MHRVSHHYSIGIAIRSKRVYTAKQCRQIVPGGRSMARRTYEVYLRWWRSPIELVDGRLVQDVARATAYELPHEVYEHALGAEAAFDLAAVHDARSAVAFAEQWGLLAGTTDAPASEQPLADMLLAAELVREP